MEFEFQVEKNLYKISLEKKNEKFLVKQGEKRFEADLHLISPNVLSLIIEGRSSLIYLAEEKGKWYVFVDGQHYLVEVPSETRTEFQKREEGDKKSLLLIKAPMPGKVIKINVTEKQEVRRNQTLAIVEAMKMENEIKSSIEGYVKKIFVSPGELVDSERPLIELGFKEKVE